MFDNIRGVVCFSAKGTRLYAFIDEVRLRKIGCRRQKMNQEILYAQCYRSDYDEICQVAESFGIEINIEQKRGAVFKALKYRLRFGIGVGLIVGLAMIFYFSNIVMQIEITGCETIDKDMVARALAGCGIERGVFIPSLDFDSCERRVMLAIDDIAWVGIRSDSCRIVVDVHEMIESPEMLNENMPCNIISRYDAQITDISVLEGIGCVQKGYAVKKGDLLISGIQEGIKGTTTVKHALGSVTGIYNVSLCFSQTLSSTLRVETENNERKNVLSVLSLDIPLYFSECEYGEYNLDSNECELYLFGKKLPISLVRNKYTQCKNVEKIYDETTAQELLYQQKQRYEKNFLDDTEILSEKVDISINETTATLRVDYTLKGEIGEKNEILIKNFN